MWMVARMPASGRQDAHAMAILLLNMAFLPLAIKDRKT